MAGRIGLKFGQLFNDVLKMKLLEEFNWGLFEGKEKARTIPLMTLPNTTLRLSSHLAFVRVM